MTETVDDAAAEAAEPQDEESGETDERPPLTELVAQLARDLSVLGFCEAQLALSRNMPQVRRVSRDLAGVVVVAVAFGTVFVFANVAAFIGLDSVLAGWVAALVLCGVWLAVGLVLLLALMARSAQVTGWKWWHIFTGGEEDGGPDLEQARADAEQAVWATLEQLAPAITVEIATAVIPSAGGMAGGIVGAGGGLLEASDDIVEAIADELPAGGVVNQIWDFVLMPGRFGVRVATTVLKRTPES